ncbi:Exocyst complex component 5 [Acorus calamus]|uniref:Exocyst complex component 5 n=1 Tax=Acorus calamus TaxID=4465 RepID=A0AAV9E3N3_ACOCL|nr:Exocyst complex component 5 [Acorus calamus]
MELNSSPGDLMELSPLFSDDSRVVEAATVAQKLLKHSSSTNHESLSFLDTDDDSDSSIVVVYYSMHQAM